jgi:AraC family transcriptional regulator
MELIHAITDVEPPQKVRLLSANDMTAVEKARAAIDGSMPDVPKITELAAVSGTSPAKLQKDFKTAFGCTIHTYEQEARMSAAIEEIRRTDKPLRVIATEFGFSSESHLAKQFRVTYGMAPGEYRRKLNG